MFGIGNGDLFLQHLVELGRTHKLIRDDNLSILFDGYLFRFEDVILLKVLLAKNSISLFLVED